jgi:ribosomal protein S18 acetylase RimI-like enzyme
MSQVPATITFKKATLEDVPKLLRFVRAYYLFDDIEYDEERVRRGLKTLVGDATLGGAWLVLENDAPGGYFVMTFGFDLEFGGRVATVTELYFDGSFRRRGLGRRTLNFAEKIARDAGAHAVELQVTHGNTEALAFYERVGFTRHDRIPMSKPVMSLDDLRLVAIAKDGAIEGVAKEVMLEEPLAGVLSGSKALYEREGFVPPFTAYVALAGDSHPGISDRAAGAIPVGTCAFKAPPREGHVEIAYFTFPAFEGRGIATWMAKKLVEIAYAEAAPPEVRAETLPKDGPSTSILRGIGFQNRGALLHPEDGLVWEWVLPSFKTVSF